MGERQTINVVGMTSEGKLLAPGFQIPDFERFVI
jgi:hypothetical protein